MKIICEKCLIYKSKLRSRKITNFITEVAQKKGISLIKGRSICNSCYLNVYKSEPRFETSEVPGPSSIQKIRLEQNSSPLISSSSSPSNSSTPEFVNPDHSSFNAFLQSINSSPVVDKKMRSEDYKKKKIQEVAVKISEEIFQLPWNSGEPNYSTGDDNNEIIQQFREKYESCETSNERYMILTSLPKSWTVRKIQREFNVSYYMARRAKQIQKDNGIMSIPNIKFGSKALNQELVEFVQNFYDDDDISRICPGKRDFETLSSEGIVVSRQRRLVLCNLKEAYQIFKTTHPSIKIGFSKFASLRPGHCVLANSSGTHSICVCVYHQNIKLMFNVIKTAKLVSNEEGSYRELICQIICENPTTSCYFNECTTCPGTENIHKSLSTKFLQNNVEEITFKQWQQVDRCTMETVTAQTLTFMDTFCEQLQNLVPHSFIAEQQASYLKHKKSNLNFDECIVICDFSENYSFVVQDAVQGFHWSNTQCTIHPFAVYYKNNKELHSLDNEHPNNLKFTSLIVISESLKHNHIAVRLFIQGLVHFIKEKLQQIKKICFFSDGSGAQYKNKMNFFNICNFKDDFGFNAEWHFFATCHGKGPCDALGGVLKRNAARASLQRPFENQITTPRELYLWAVENESKINYLWFSTDDYLAIEKKLKTRYNLVNQISGTQQYHSFLPINKTSLHAKKTSFCTNPKLFDIAK